MEHYFKIIRQLMTMTQIFVYFQRAQILQLGAPQLSYCRAYNKSCKEDMASSIIQLFRNSELSFIMDFCKTISTFLSHNLKLFIYVLISKIFGIKFTITNLILDLVEKIARIPCHL